MGLALFLTGTGTGIGKTALGLALACAAGRRGRKVAYHKPVQCGLFQVGCSPGGDADWVGRLCPYPVTICTTYKLARPCSPHLAAEGEGVALEWERIAADLRRLREGHDLVLVEGAGGPAVPLDRGGFLMADLAARLDLPVLLAIAPGLGTLNHSLLSHAFLAARGLVSLGFAAVQAEPGSPDLYPDNRRTVAALTGLADWGLVPHLPAVAAGRPLGADGAAALAAGVSDHLEEWWTGARIP